jgi:hypothetical protein
MGCDVVALMLPIRRATSGLLQIARIKLLSKPAVDRSEKLASLLPLTLVAPETRHDIRPHLFSFGSINHSLLDLQALWQ